VALAAGDKFVFLSGFTDKLQLVSSLVAKFSPDFTPDTKIILFVVNIAKPVIVDLNGATLEIIPLLDGMVWNELADLIGYEKDDFKGQTAQQKVATLVAGLAKRKTKAEKVSFEEALALEIEVRREVRGAI
jgi:hypothetical protein